MKPFNPVHLPRAIALFHGSAKASAPAVGPENRRHVHCYSKSLAPFALMRAWANALIAVLCVALFSLGLTACGGGGSSSSASPNTSGSRIAVTGITLDKNAATLIVGGTTQLTPTVAPANATNASVTWTSDLTTVATVSSSGLVTAVAVGTAKITATTVDGSFTATSTISVSPVVVPVTSITLNKTSATVTVGSTTQLTPTITPANATNTNVTWASSNNGIATVSSSGMVTGVAAGTASITATTADGNKLASSQVTVLAPWLGTKSLGASGKETKAYGVATDAEGNVLVAGRTYGALDGNKQIGTSDFFLTSYNAGGIKQYTRQLGGSGGDSYGTGVATDTAGNVYVTGSTEGPLDGNTKVGSQDYFLTKYDSKGVKQFTRELGAADGGAAFATGIATDTKGNVYVTGQTGSGLNGNQQTGFIDLFLTKFDSAGTPQFTKQLGSKADYSITSNAIATDINGNVYVAGETDAGIDGNIQTGFSDFFLTKFDSSGTRQFTKQMGVLGTEKNTIANAVATDANGNVYIVGFTEGALNGSGLTGTKDFFVAKYDSTGKLQFIKLLGAAGASTIATGVATDASGNVFVVGSTNGNLDGNLRTGNSDLFLTKYDSSGTKKFTKLLGALSADTSAVGVRTDAKGNVFVTGNTEGNLDGNTRTGTKDFFVTKYSNDGAKQ